MFLFTRRPATFRAMKSVVNCSTYLTAVYRNSNYLQILVIFYKHHFQICLLKTHFIYNLTITWLFCLLRIVKQSKKVQQSQNCVNALFGQQSHFDV